MNPRRLRTVLPVAALVVTGAAQMAFGYNRSLGAGSGAAAVGTISAPSVTATSPATASAHVAWTAVSGPVGDSAPVSYTVMRSANAGSTWSATNGTCAGSLSGTACDDVLDTAGNYLYRVTASYRSWTSRGTSTAVAINTTPPTVVSIERAPAESDPTKASSVGFRVTFSESVSGVDVTDFIRTTAGTIAGTTTSSVAPVSGAVYDVTVGTGTGDGTIRLDLSDNDSITNSGGTKLGGTGTGNGDFATGQSFSIDRTSPTASITSTPDVITNSTSAGFSFSATDSTIGGVSSGVARVECRLDSAAFATCLSPKSYSALSAGSHTFEARAVDNVGNTGGAAGFTWVIDTTSPTVTINQASGQADPTNASPINFTVVFGEATSDFATGDVTVTGTAGGTKTATVTGSGTTYNVAVTGMTTSGTVIASVGSGAAHDAAGNANAASTFTDSTVTWDVDAPTVTINQASGQADPTNASPINFTVVFSEATSDFATGDVTVTGTAGGTKTATVTGSGTTYNVAVTGMTTDGTVIASIASTRAHDAVGNSNTASTSTDNTVTWDATAPTVTSVVLANNGTLGTAAKGDEIVVTYSEVMDASRFCSTWVNGSTQLLDANGVVTVTITNSGSNDVLSVATSSGCSINFGTVALNADYVSATTTFSGNGSNVSTFAWVPAARTITIRLGGKAGGTTNSSIAASIPSYTPPAVKETDLAGNAIGAGPFTGSSSRL